MSVNKYVDIRPLFSGASNGTYNDARSDLFASKLLELQNITNGFGNPSDDKTGISNIITARNYHDSSKPSGMRDADIHYEFVEWVKDVAKYHAEFDRPSVDHINAARLEAVEV